MILITCPIHEFFLKTLTDRGLSYRHEPAITYDELFSKLKDLEGIVISTSIAINQKLLDAATSLQWIARLGSGMEHIDVAYATQKNIRCYSSPEGNRDAVADHTLGLLLALCRNICKSNNEVKSYAWLRKENTGVELSGKKVGIIGYGNTGTVFARRLMGFDVELLVHDKYKSGFERPGLQEVSLAQILEEVDVLSFHLPYTQETHYYANQAFFNQLKKKPILINTSRGSIIDTQALWDALERGNVACAGLDVLENEVPSTFQLPENELLRKIIQHPRVLTTPHIAGYTQEANYKMARILLEKLGFL